MKVKRQNYKPNNMNKIKLNQTIFIKAIFIKKRIEF